MKSSLPLSIFAATYQKLVRPALFRFDAEKVHHAVISFGQLLGRVKTSTPADPLLTQKILGLEFRLPVGLAAGFDFEGKLPQLLPVLGFGFGTVGTITNKPSAGNPRPRLGRLPKSLSLMVNKGFRNPGASEIITRLSSQKFSIPIGVSIGSREADIGEIVAAFEKFENSTAGHVYYELNISCPNLQTKREFYSSKNLTALLKAVDSLKVSRPIFVKMPISKTDQEILSTLETISAHCPQGVILGNLQKNREILHPDEQTKYAVGNFSGKPTYQRSNELIKLSYRRFKNRFVIIGCGGVFSAADAYEKVKFGASLVQLITGLVFEGPQLVAQINLGLRDLLKCDGFKNISEAVGVASG